jgi:hypothetical protein
MRNLVLFYVFLMIVSCNNVDDSLQKNMESKNLDKKEEPMSLVGKTIEYAYGDDTYQVTIDDESHLHWEAMAGTEKGVTGEETYKIDLLADSLLFITWGEENGIGVSQVLDFKKGMVYNHLLRGRAIDTGLGKIRLVD